MSNSPFLNILKGENLSKLKIDKSLVPSFKIVMQRINDYFISNNLMDAKDWDSILTKYLLTPGENQFKINLVSEIKIDDCAAGNYDYNTKTINVLNNGNFINTLCHEFIHFLVMTDKYEDLGWKLSNSPFMNEGLTEFLNMNIMNKSNITAYYPQVMIAEYYCNLVGKNQAFRNFLNNHYVNENEDNRYSQNIFLADMSLGGNNKKKTKVFQQLLTNHFINFEEVNSFDSFIDKINKLNSRVEYDSSWASRIYNELVDSYLNNIGISNEKELYDTLVYFCHLSNNAYLFGNEEVAEYKIDDISIAFDRNGQHYQEFPLSGAKEMGNITITRSGDNVNIQVFHKDKKYDFNTNNMRFKNWLEEYNIYYPFMENMMNKIEKLKITNKKNLQ